MSFRAREILLVFIFFPLLSLSCPFYSIEAADFSLGIRYLYPMWEMQDYNILIRENWYYRSVYGENWFDGVDDIRMSGAGMVGAELGINFSGKLDFLTAFRFGNFTAEIENKALTVQNDITAETEYQFETDARRIEINALIRYRMMNLLTAYAGFEYLDFSMKGIDFNVKKTLEETVPAFYTRHFNDYREVSMGPLLGLNHYRPLLSGKWFWLIGGSAAYLLVDPGGDEETGDDPVYFEESEKSGFLLSAETGIFKMFLQGKMSLEFRYSYDYYRLNPQNSRLQAVSVSLHYIFE